MTDTPRLWDRPADETPKSYAAFLAYVALGARRSDSDGRSPGSERSVMIAHGCTLPDGTRQGIGFAHCLAPETRYQNGGRGTAKRGLRLRIRSTSWLPHDNAKVGRAARNHAHNLSIRALNEDPVHLIAC